MGTYYYMTKMQAIMTQLTNQAARGDIKATRMCFASPGYVSRDQGACSSHNHQYFTSTLCDAKDGAPAPLEDNDDKAKIPMEER